VSFMDTILVGRARISLPDNTIEGNVVVWRVAVCGSDGRDNARRGRRATGAVGFSKAFAGLTGLYESGPPGAEQLFRSDLIFLSNPRTRSRP